MAMSHRTGRSTLARVWNPPHYSRNIFTREARRLPEICLARARLRIPAPLWRLLFPGPGRRGLTITAAQFPLISAGSTFAHEDISTLDVVALTSCLFRFEQTISKPGVQ